MAEPSGKKMDNLTPKLGKLVTNFSYGVGTWLTNDFPDPSLNIVIKMTKVLVNGEWIDVVKLSDDPGKHSGKESEAYKAKLVLGIGQQPTLCD